MSKKRLKELADQLTPKLERFCRAYVVEKNGAEAVRKAGYSPNNANVTAAKNLANPKVQAYIDALRASVGDTYDSTIATLEEIARFHTQAIRNDVTQIQVSEKSIVIGEGAYASAVESVKYDRDTGEPVEVRCVSKLKAAEDLGKHLGYFDKDNEQRKPSITVMVPPVESIPDDQGDSIE